VELLILITQLSRAENGPGAFAVSSRPALRNKLTATPSLATTTGTNITTTTRRPPDSPAAIHHSPSLPLSATSTATTAAAAAAVATTTIAIIHPQHYVGID